MIKKKVKYNFEGKRCSNCGEIKEEISFPDEGFICFQCRNKIGGDSIMPKLLK